MHRFVLGRLYMFKASFQPERPRFANWQCTHWRMAHESMTLIGLTGAEHTYFENRNTYLSYKRSARTNARPHELSSTHCHKRARNTCGLSLYNQMHASMSAGRRACLRVNNFMHPRVVQGREPPRAMGFVAEGWPHTPHGAKFAGMVGMLQTQSPSLQRVAACQCASALVTR